MDDFKLKQAGTPGMTNPPTVTPPPPAPVRAAADVANQKNPAVPGSNYIGNAPTDPDTNARPVAAPSTLNVGDLFGVVANRNAAASEEARVQAMYPKGTFSSPDVASAPAQVPAAPAQVPAAPAPEAKPQPAYDGSEADRINAAVAGNTPAAQGNLGDARVTTMPNGQKLFTNVSNDADAIAGLSAKSGMQYSGGAAGMPSPQGNPNLGTAADNMRQIQNMQALSASTPQGGVAILNDPNEAANAEKTKRWALDDAIANMKKAGTRTERAALGQLVNTMAAGQNATEVEGMRQGGQNTRQAGTNAVQMRGQDLTHSAQTRGQDMQHQVGMGNIDANLYGTNMRVQEAATGRKHDLTKLGMINTNENSQIKARTEGLQAVERMKIEAEARKPMKMQTATGEILITRDNSGNMQGVTPTMKKGANGTMEYDLTAFGGMPPPGKKP